MIAVAATVVVGLLVAGCGSSTSTSTSATASAATTTPALTKAEFLAKANAICIQGNKQTDAAGKALRSAPSRAQVVKFVGTDFAPAIQGQIAGIRALGAPTGDQATVTTMLNLAQTDLNKLKRNPALLAGKSSPFADFAKLAHSYGLTSCATAG